MKGKNLKVIFSERKNIVTGFLKTRAKYVDKILFLVAIVLLAVIGIVLMRLGFIIHEDKNVSYYGKATPEFHSHTSLPSLQSIISSAQIHTSISPEKAYQLAYPLLMKSFDLRKKDRHEASNPHSVKVDRLILKGDYYYVTRDDRGFYLLQAYFKHAVKVHKDTGTVIAPE